MPRRRKRGGKLTLGKIVGAVKSANNWLKKTKAISNVAGALANANVPYASRVADIAGKAGYGKKRRRRRRK